MQSFGEKFAREAGRLLGRVLTGPAGVLCLIAIAVQVLSPGLGIVKDALKHHGDPETYEPTGRDRAPRAVPQPLLPPPREDADQHPA